MASESRAAAIAKSLNEAITTGASAEGAYDLLMVCISDFTHIRWQDDGSEEAMVFPDHSQLTIVWDIWSNREKLEAKASWCCIGIGFCQERDGDGHTMLCRAHECTPHICKCTFEEATA